MSDMQIQLVLPLFALIALYFITLFILLKRRLTAIKKKQIPAHYFKTLTHTPEFQVPRLLEQAQRHFINLFEMPVLIFSLVPLLLHFNLANPFFIFGLWIFTLARYLQAYVHLTTNKLFIRMSVYAVGVFTVLAL